MCIRDRTNVERWEAAYTNSQPSNGWQEFQFDDSNWKKGKAAFGSRDMERIHTEWKGEMCIRDRPIPLANSAFSYFPAQRVSSPTNSCFTGSYVRCLLYTSRCV